MQLSAVNLERADGETSREASGKVVRSAASCRARLDDLGRCGGIAFEGEARALRGESITAPSDSGSSAWRLYFAADVTQTAPATWNDPVIAALRNAASSGRAPEAPTIPAARQFVDSNRVALRLAREAARFPMGRTPSERDYLSHYVHLQRLDYAHAVEMLYALVQGRGQDALVAAVSRIRLLRIFSEGDVVDIGVKARTWDTLLADIGLALGRPLPAQVDALDAALSQAFAESEIADALRREARWMNDMAIPALSSTSPLRPVWRRAGVGAHRASAACIAAARQPWPKRLTIMRSLTGDRTYAWLPGSGGVLTTHAVFQSCNMVTQAVARSMAGVNAARVALRLEHDRLATGHLPDIPGESIVNESVDPFTGRSLLYRREPDGFVVYSVGADGKDDAGDVIAVGAPADRLGVAPGNDAGVRVRTRR